MACDRETMLLISVFADGEATPEESARAREHLAECGECRAAYEQWQSQRGMLEWAYSEELPEAASVDWSAQPAAKGKLMSTIARTTQRHPGIRWSPPLAWAGALGVVIISLVAYHLATMSPTLRVGATVAAGAASQCLRMEGGIQLRVGPDSKVSRVDAHTIRLEQGWVNASVHHGTGLRVLTRRMEVIDQGTIFEVGSGSKLDYVSVEEGSVRVERRGSSHDVRAGQVLMARDECEPVVAAMTPDEEPDEGRSLIPDGSNFLPTGADSLDWDEGIERLAASFPDARWTGSCSGGPITVHGKEFRLSVGSVPGVKSGLREHFSEIAEAMTVGRAESGDWEVPVALMQVYGVLTEPELPADIYYVRLVCESGKMVWRLTGSLGSEADYPLTTGSSKEISPDHYVYGSRMEPLLWTHSPVLGDGTYATHISMRLQLDDWPGDIKPELNLKLGGMSVSQSRRDDLAMVAEVERRAFAAVSIDQFQPRLLYLDRSRKHKVLLAWDSDPSEALWRLYDRAKRGYGGSVVLGALSTNVAMEKPEADGGVYLLRLVQPNGNAVPHIELVTADGHEVDSWRASSITIPDDAPMRKESGGSVYCLGSSPRYGQMSLMLWTKRVGDSFGLQFGVLVGPGASTANDQIPWVAGTVFIRRP